MIYVEKWKVILVIATCALAVLFSLPNFLSQKSADALPDWLPHKQIALGLDLQGGAHLLYEVDVNSIVRERVRSATDVQKAREAVRNIDPEMTLQVQGDHVTIQFTDRALRDRRLAAVDQAIEIVRRRVDEMGVRESTVQREGEDR